MKLLLLALLRVGGRYRAASDDSRAPPIFRSLRNLSPETRGVRGEICLPGRCLIRTVDAQLGIAEGLADKGAQVWFVRLAGSERAKMATAQAGPQSGRQALLLRLQ